MDSILLKFKAKFIEEAHGLLDNLELDLLELEKNPKEKELIESAFRAMHTIKGVSGMYGFGHVKDYTHHMESIYQSIREESMMFNQSVFDVSFASIDHLRKLLTDENLENTELSKQHEALLEKIQLLLCNDTVQKAIENNLNTAEKSNTNLGSTYNIILKTNENLYFRGISITDIFKDLAAIGEFSIEKVPQLSTNEEEAWSIFLKSHSSIQDIREILMFIEDDCIIQRVGDTKAIEEVGRKSTAYINDGYETINIAVSNVNETQSSDHSIENNELPGSNSSLIYQEKQVVKRISVDAAKLDQLMFLVSELITVNSRFQQDASNIQYEPLWDSFEKIDSLAKSFRNNAIEIRLVPLSDTILRFQRLIRDLAKHLNKKVELITQGIDTELDKNTVDHLAEPLMHIIRNCIDHGIENPNQRLEKGKPETGFIKISASQSGNYITIVIEDDGMGIDPEKIRKKAIEKRLIDETNVLTQSELFDLIFVPGFSTAQNLTDVSGRGVGMDIVRKKINELRGEVYVESESGSGTRFILKIQQSLSILDTLLFKVENTFFTIPVAEIELCDDADLHEIETNRHTSTIEYRDELISFVDLRKALGVKGHYNERIKKIILHANYKRMAVLADSIIGEHQAVLKPLGKAFFNNPIISSASQLGDGSMAFMLDTNIMAKKILELV